jgi:ankyrin repeat protein
MKNRAKNIVLSALFLFSLGLAQAGSFTDFFRAIDVDDVAAVQSLLANGFDPNAANAKGNSALYMALRDKSLKVAKLLIEQPKIKLDQLNPSDENALMIASLLGDQQLVQEMIERGAEINKPGWTPLAYAATNGHSQIVQFLLDHAAYIDAAAPNGTTPLMLAAYFGHDATVKLLLDEGADASLKNQLGFTALDLAKQRGHKGAAGLIASFQPKAPPQGHW